MGRYRNLSSFTFLIALIFECLSLKIYSLSASLWITFQFSRHLKIIWPPVMASEHCAVWWPYPWTIIHLFWWRNVTKRQMKTTLIIFKFSIKSALLSLPSSDHKSQAWKVVAISALETFLKIDVKLSLQGFNWTVFWMWSYTMYNIHCRIFVADFPVNETQDLDRIPHSLLDLNLLRLYITTCTGRTDGMQWDGHITMFQ